MAPFNNNSLLASQEKNRLMNYLKVIGLQDNNNHVAEEDKNLQIEKTIMQFIDILSDDKNHNEVWTIFENEAREVDQGDLPLFSKSLTNLLLIPQPDAIKKILTVLHCMCMANKDELKIAAATIKPY